MEFRSALAAGEDAGDVVRKLADTAASAGDGGADLALLFLQGELSEHVGEVVSVLRDRLAPRVLLGCTCEGVIGAERELERQPGAALLTARLPGVDLRPFHIPIERWRPLLTEDESLQQLVGTGEAHRAQLVLGDPYSTPANELLASLNRLFPTAPTFGGMASGGAQAGRNALILDDAVTTDGAVGVGIGGAVEVDAVVSQGCRPIGEPFVITRSEEHWIYELGRRPALDVVEQLIGELPESDRRLLENGLFIGLVTNEYQERFQRGDFLIRHVMGGNRETSAVAVGELVRMGQSVQFQVRDADTATEDLQELLASQPLPAPAGALLFSCNGRGTRMFPAADHDIRQLHARFPGIPCAGFFAAGEIGPIGSQSFLHGHTASIALFRPAA